jgi:hypothetical protein
MELSELPWLVQHKIYFFLHRSYMREIRAEIDNCLIFIYYRENRKSPYKLSWWYGKNSNYYQALII